MIFKSTWMMKFVWVFIVLPTLQSSNLKMKRANNGIGNDSELIQITYEQFIPTTVLPQINEKSADISIEQGFKNETYAEKFIFMKYGSDGNFDGFDNLHFNSTLKSLELKCTDNKRRNFLANEQSRVTINEKREISVKNAQFEDSGKYICTAVAVISGTGETKYYKSVTHLNVYSSPDLALRFPFIFEVLYCNDKQSKEKLGEVKTILCKDTCVYEFTYTCSAEPLFLKNVPNPNPMLLEITAIKYAHPNYRPPFCSNDCIMANKFDHIQSNLESLKMAISLISTTPQMKFYPDETLSRRKLIYVCNAGFSLYKETCLPCFPGKFNSHRGNNNCSECPMKYYQNNPAAKECFLCPSGQNTDGSGSDNVKNCHIIEKSFVKLSLYFIILGSLTLGVIAIILVILLAKCRDRMKKINVGDDSKSKKQLLQHGKRDQKRIIGVRKTSSKISKDEISRHSLSSRNKGGSKTNAKSGTNKRSTRNSTIAASVHSVESEIN